MRTRFYLLPLLAVALSACGGDDDTTTTTITPPTSAEVLAAGPYGLGVATVIYTDTSRPTMANGDQPASPSRRLVTEIWYPTTPVDGAPVDGQRNAAIDTSGGPYPLIIYSHGFLDQRQGAAYIGRHLATHGYIVAAPNFPLTYFGTLGGPNGADLVNQPGDVSFLIDTLLADVAENRFAGAADPQRVGLAGFSFGGATTFLATFHPTLRDPRVRAAATIAGGGCMFSDKFFDFADVPLLIIHGDIDAIVPYALNGPVAFMRANTPKYFLTVLEGSHTAFSEIAAVIFDQLDNPDEPGCTALGGPRSPDDSGEEPPPDAVLGGEENGIIDGPCPASCVGPFPRALRPPRQRQIANLALLPFFDFYLKGKEEMRVFLEQSLAAENPEAKLEFAR